MTILGALRKLISRAPPPTTTQETQMSTLQEHLAALKNVIDRGIDMVDPEVAHRDASSKLLIAITEQLLAGGGKPGSAPLGFANTVKKVDKTAADLEALQKRVTDLEDAHGLTADVAAQAQTEAAKATASISELGARLDAKDTPAQDPPAGETGTTPAQ